MKYALVTGGVKGIGRAISLELVKAGYFVFLHYHSDYKKAEETATELKKMGKKYGLLQGDISLVSDVQMMFQEIAKITNSLDLVVNNAGMDFDMSLEAYDLDKMKRVIDVNLWGTVLVTKLAIPLLKKSKQGQIINISSRMGNAKVIPGVSAYAPSKAGIIQFTKCCALELGKYKIRANTVCPGLTDTELTRKLLTDGNIWQQAAEANPLGRVGRPEDVANLVAFLASEKAAYINGESILVDGGSVLV